MRLGNYKEACAVFRELLKIAPNNTQPYFEIAKCFDKLGNKTEAQRYYRKFLQTNPTSPQKQYAKNRMTKFKSQKNNYLSLV